MLKKKKKRWKTVIILLPKIQWQQSDDDNLQCFSVINC